MIYIFVFISTQRDYKVKNESTRNNKLETAGGGHRRGRSDSPPRNTETTSFLVVFLLCRCSCFVAVLVLVVAFVVLGVPFVFAALIVCAAGVMLNVAVVALVIKQKNKEASRKAKSSEGRKAKNNAKQTNKTHRN